MKSRGFDLHVISSPGERLDRFAENEGIIAHAIPMAREIKPLKDVVSLARLYRLLRKLRPSIVDAHFPKGAFLGLIAAFLARVPVRVYHLHGLRFSTSTGAKRALLKSTERLSCLLATHIISVSDSVQSAAVEEGLCPPEKVRVLLGGSINGVDTERRFNAALVGKAQRQVTRERMGIPLHATTIGFVGRVVRDKGIVELVAAWKRLREQVADLHLLVVGPFEYQDPLPPEVEGFLRSDERIHLVGFVDDTASMYAAMDLVVLPTYREGFPVTLLEAAAMALPVVATRVTGCVNAVIDGVTGTLVPARDAITLADAILRYLHDPVLRREHGEAGRERVIRDFQQEALWIEQYRMYASCLHDSAPQQGQYATADAN
jgi:glycosyltransferase involved in cell wall biosynthesis